MTEETNKISTREDLLETFTPAEEQAITEALLRDTDFSDEAERELQRFEEKVMAPRRRFFGPLLRVAAVLALVVSATVIWFYSQPGKPEGLVYEAKAEVREITLTRGGESTVVHGDEIKADDKKSSIEWQTINVPAGKSMKIQLSDGTEVWLNDETTLSYPSRFDGDKREVRLMGEAYFKVKSDSLHPFIVRSGDMETRVLGTEFNVESREESGQQRVTLVSGSVNISHTGRAKGVHLVPNQSATLEGDGFGVASVNVDDIICWRDGIELYDDSTLEEILLRLGHWYNLTVICRHDKTLQQRMHFVYDRNQNIEKAIESLSKISKIKINLKNNIIFVE